MDDEPEVCDPFLQIASKQADPLPTSELHPVKCLALLFLHQEEAYGGEEGNVEQVSLFLPINSHNTFQQPL